MKSFARNISTSVAALFLVASPAFSNEATDFFTKFTPADPCDWSGVYFGLNVGGSWNHFDISQQRTDVDLAQQFYLLLEGDEDGGPVVGEASAFITFRSPGHEQTVGATIGGIQSGVNFQVGHFVFGAEGSFVGNGADTSTKFQEFQENEVFLFTINQNVTAETLFTSWRSVETRWNGFIGGRFGFCWNRLLFYGTGGVAFTDLHFDSMQRADTAFFGFIGDGEGQALAEHTKSTGVANKHAVNQQQGFFLGEIVNNKNRSETDILTGYYGGVGTEYKLTNNVSVALEYRHVDWGDHNGDFTTGPHDGPVFPSDFNSDLSADQVVFKVNVMVSHFNPFH